MSKLEGRVALVTGGSRGIGRGISLKLARRGMCVAINYTSSKNYAEQVASEIISHGGRSLAVRADVSRSDEVEAMVKTIQKELGTIGVLVNNAGTGDLDYKGVSSVTEDTWDRIHSVNLKGTFLCCRAVIPSMLEEHWGRIINISSTAGITGGTSGAHYASSKGGIISFTRALAKELASSGITVNSVAPGKIDTDLFRASTPAEDIQEVTGKIPVGRLGKPEDIASAVAFFALPGSEFITGQVLVVSGGY